MNSRWNTLDPSHGLLDLDIGIAYSRQQVIKFHRKNPYVFVQYNTNGDLSKVIAYITSIEASPATYGVLPGDSAQARTVATSLLHHMYVLAYIMFCDL